MCNSPGVPLKRSVRRLTVLVDVASMADLDDHDHQFLVANLVHDAVGTLSDAIAISRAGEFLVAWRSWIGCEARDAPDELSADLLRLDPLDLLGRGAGADAAGGVPCRWAWLRSRAHGAVGLRLARRAA